MDDVEANEGKEERVALSVLDCLLRSTAAVTPIARSFIENGSALSLGVGLSVRAPSPQQN